MDFLDQGEELVPAKTGAVLRILQALNGWGVHVRFLFKLWPEFMSTV
jgi:hypothetical protein